MTKFEPRVATQMRHTAEQREIISMCTMIASIGLCLGIVVRDLLVWDIYPLDPLWIALTFVVYEATAYWASRARKRYTHYITHTVGEVNPNLFKDADFPGILSH